MINKDNIEDVLKFNGINNFRFTDRTIKFIKDTGMFNLPFLEIDLSEPKLLELIEFYFDKKLKPLPDFNFKEYLKNENILAIDLPYSNTFKIGEFKNDREAIISFPKTEIIKLDRKLADKIIFIFRELKKCY